MQNMPIYMKYIFNLKNIQNMCKTYAKKKTRDAKYVKYAKNIQKSSKNMEKICG